MIRKILRSILCGLLVLICLFLTVVGIGKHQLGCGFLRIAKSLFG